MMKIVGINANAMSVPLLTYFLRGRRKVLFVYVLAGIQHVSFILVLSQVELYNCWLCRQKRK